MTLYLLRNIHTTKYTYYKIHILRNIHTTIYTLLHTYKKNINTKHQLRRNKLIQKKLRSNSETQPNPTTPEKHYDTTKQTKNQHGTETIQHTYVPTKLANNSYFFTKNQTQPTPKIKSKNTQETYTTTTKYLFPYKNIRTLRESIRLYHSNENFS